MHIVQSIPDEKAIMENGDEVTPLVTLKDEYGSISHIIIDDHCYVLINGSEERAFKMTCHWYKEAVYALVQLIMKELTS
jgi:hypothetical protein